MTKFYLIFVGVSPNSRIISSIRFPTGGKLLVKLTAGKIVSLWLIHTATETEGKQDRERERWVPISCAELYTLHRNREQCTGGRVNKVDCIESSLEKLCVMAENLSWIKSRILVPSIP